MAGRMTSVSASLAGAGRTRAIEGRVVYRDIYGMSGREAFENGALGGARRGDPGDRRRGGLVSRRRLARSLRRGIVAGAIAAGVLAPSAAASIATDEMERCAALGPKPPGSAAGRAQADRIAERFRAAGLETRFEDFHMPVYVVNSTRIAVVGPNARDVPGETFAFGGTGAVEAEVVDVGVGRPSDYAGKDVRGKIVLVERNEAFHRSSQLSEVVAHGGAAMLYVSGSPDNLVQTGTVRFAQTPPAEIPTVTVGANDGAVLRADLRDGGLRMAVEVDAVRQDAVARNVIGVRRGTTHPDEVVLVGGHYDNWHHGAVDNCSAIGSMLDMVESTKDIPPAYTVIFAAWDAEEIGLTGSYDFVMRHQDIVRQTVVNENLEMTSAATYVSGNRLDYSLLNVLFGTVSPAMNSVIATAAARNAFAPVPTTAFGVRQISGGIIPTDLQPFYSQGVQGFSTFSSTPYYHTAEDDPDKIDRASHDRVTSYLRDVLLGLQQVPPEALRFREVPRVAVHAPPTAAPGADIPVDVWVTDPAGRPVTGAPVKVLSNQQDHWPVDEGFAEEVGNGLYRYRVPAGATDADLTSLTATVSQPLWIAEGYAGVNQRAGGLLGPAPRECTRRRVITVRVRGLRRGERIVRLRARSTAGRVRVSRSRRTIRLDLRGTRRGTVRLRIAARTSSGRLIRQSRLFRPCVTRASLARVVGG
jgi:aminopeptidase YwaD